MVKVYSLINPVPRERIFHLLFLLLKNSTLNPLNPISKISLGFTI